VDFFAAGADLCSVTLHRGGGGDDVDVDNMSFASRFAMFNN
jgi:hypothetical protein